MSKGRPRITFRLDEEYVERLRVRAAGKKQSAHEYARTLIVATLNGLDESERLADRHLQILGDSMQQMREEMKAGLLSVEKLAGAAVASSALLRDDETQPTPVAQERVGKHVRVALVAAPSVVELFRKS